MVVPNVVPLGALVEVTRGFGLRWGELRAPLDVMRTGVRPLPWKPLVLSELRVGQNEELVNLLQLPKDLQAQSGRVLPLLLDEKVYYQLCRLMYATSFRRWDTRSHLRDLPLLYGIWHPYKMVVGTVSKRYYQILAPLLMERDP